MTNNKPLVSFVIPTHNRASLLKECLDSVLNQTYSNFDVVVVNDNSTDNTEEVLRSYSGQYSNLSYFINDGKGGNAARNLGVLKALGEYIAFMDDDDICEPYRIEEQLKPIIESNYFYDFIISGYRIFKYTGTITNTVNYKKPLDSVGYPQRWLVKKEILLKAALFDINQPALQDVEFYWRLKKYAKVFFSSTHVVNIRISPMSITKDHKKMILGINRLLELHGPKMLAKERNIWNIILCKKYAGIGDWKMYKDKYNNLDKFRAPVSALFLFFAYLGKFKFLLQFHSKVSELYFKFNNS